MADRIRIDGRTLRHALFERGVEFPCGGTSLCGSCRVRVLEGDIPITPEMREVLTADELASGWRLACMAEARGAVTLEIGQWETPILADDSTVAFEPGHGYGAAVDIGTTTLVAQLLNLATGEVEEVRTALNPQSVHGSDVMSRIEYDLREPGVLARCIRSAVGSLVSGWQASEVLLAGNTVMHHLFCGIDVEPLSHVPFETRWLDARIFDSGDLGWRPGARVEFLPSIGGFAGSDLLAGIIAVGMPSSEHRIALVDLGTNGEIAVGNRDGIVCASTAAGPAFEAGRIRMGMRAASGAIGAVEVRDGALECSVIGGGTARGICGSGLVDAAAAGLELGCVNPRGRMAVDFALRDGVVLVQSDIRQLQLAKGAIAAGLSLLGGDRVSEIHLAGAFGNYVRVASAKRIGLLPPAAAVVPAGNSALRGLKMLLLSPSKRTALITLAFARMQHVPLASMPDFEDRFVECMGFAGGL